MKRFTLEEICVSVKIKECKKRFANFVTVKGKTINFRSEVIIGAKILAEDLVDSIKKYENTE